MANRSRDEDKVLKPKTNRDSKQYDSIGDYHAATEAAKDAYFAKKTAAPATTTPTTITPTTTAPNSGYSGASSSGKASTSAPLSTERNLTGSLGNYDPAAYEAYTQALQALETARGQAPVYNNTYGDQLNALYAQITGREAFKYDLDSDPMYQQYRDQYMMQGQQAMMDTMGQAAALTGGHGSTYSQAVGQQQYNAYLQDINAVVPDLYQNAYSRWADEGDRLINQYGMLSDLADTEYGRYRDSMSDYWNNVSYAQQQAELEYNRGLSEWEREYQLNEDKRAQQESDYERVMNLMGIGYKPTADEISAAGMSEAEADAWMKYIASQKTSSSGGSGGSGGGSGVKWSDAGIKASDYLVDMFYHNDYINPGSNYSTDMGSNSMSYDETESVAKNYLNALGIAGSEQTEILEAVMAGYGKSQAELKELWNLPDDYK